MIVQRRARATWSATSIPAILLFLLTVAVPASVAVLYAFTGKRLGEPVAGFTLTNFSSALREPLFTAALRTSLRFAVVCVVTKLAIGYGLAGILTHAGRSATAALRLLLLPWLIPGSAACLLWVWLLYQPSGVLDHLVRSVLGHPSRDILGSADGAFWSLVAFNVWRETPFWALVFFASRKLVPPQLQEELRLAGTSTWFAERTLVAAYSAPTVLVCSAISFVWTFGEFQSIELITRGGPSNHTQTVASVAMDIGYAAGIDLGTAICMMLLTLPIILPAVLLLFVIAKRRRAALIT